MAPSVSSSRATSFCAPLALDRLRQQPLQQGERLQRLAQIMAGGGEKARLGDIGQLGLPLGRLQRVRRALALGDVGEGDDDAFDPVVLGAVGQMRRMIPDAAPALRSRARSARGSAAPSRASVEKSAVGGQRVEVGERPADVAGNDAEQRLGRRREEADVEIGVEKQRRDVGAVQDVLQIVGGRALPLQGFLSWLLSAVSSSLSDCSSSFEVSSSSLVDWNSSLTDSASSLIAFCSSLEISRLRMAPCSSVRVASSSCSSSATRGVIRRCRRAASASARCFGSSTKQTSSKLLALAQNRLDGDAERDRRCRSR